MIGAVRAAARIRVAPSAACVRVAPSAANTPGGSPGAYPRGGYLVTAAAVPFTSTFERSVRALSTSFAASW